MPDDELLSLAERRQLSAPAVLDAQVKRMLADPKAFAMAENFAGQWLEIRNLDSIKPDPQKFPAWAPELRDAMKTETRMFFDWILRENRPIGEFLDARYTFLNEFLANYYGIEGVTGPEFRRVELTTDRARRRAEPWQRARRLQLSDADVGRHPRQVHPAEHPRHAAAAAAAGRAARSTRRRSAPPRRCASRWRSTATNAVCASCHSRMDPLGFALENYDAIGKWRTEDGGFPVDSSGVLPSGKSFTNPAEMRQILSQHAAGVRRAR